MEKKLQPKKLMLSEAQASDEKNSLLEVILDQIDAFIYVKDSKGRYRYANDKYHELLNFTHNDWEGMSDFEFMNEESAQQVRRNEQQVLANGESTSFEETIIVDGRERYFVSYKIPLSTDTGYRNWVCNFATEITDFKKEIPVLEGFEVSN